MVTLFNHGFALVTNSLFELNTPEWLDESYYSKSHIMTAVAAHIAAHNKTSTDDTQAGMQALWNDIFVMDKETYVHRIIDGISFTIYRMPTDPVKYEIVAYKCL